MINRILAFLITGKQDSQPSNQRALKHLQGLAESFSKKVATVQLKKYCLHLVYEGDLDELLLKDHDEIKFCVGPHKLRKNSGWGFTMENRRKIRDLFLLIRISNEKVTITNDCGGTLPVYYSLRNDLCLSNIEPAVILNSDSTYDDLFPESIYELLRYSHLLGTTTLYRHIMNQEPDSTYVYCGTSEPLIEYNYTLSPAEGLTNKKDEDVVAELFDLNRSLVHEALADEEDIILPLSSGYDSRMLLAAAIENKDIKSKLRCYTYTPNMSLETRQAQKLCKVAGVNWEKIQLPVESFSMGRLNQVLEIFGSSLHVHGKYQLDFLDQIKHAIDPERSVFVTGYMTGGAVGASYLRELNLCNGKTPLAEALGHSLVQSYIPDEYLAAHSRLLNSEMKYQAEPTLQKTFARTCGSDDSRAIMFDLWTRLRNFYSYQPRVLDWGVSHIGPHFNPEFLNFSLAMSPELMKKKKSLEMVLAKYYPRLSRVASNSNLTVNNILKRSIANPSDGLRHYLPLLIKYYFKQPWLLPEKLIAEMKDPVVPNLHCIGKDGVFPLFDLNAESREIFDGYFDLNEAENLFSRAMSGDHLSCKRLTILEALAYALKLLEK